ncbi:S1C family serine protease [Streptomyces angustmyceticus]|uniref:S1C family serine protease n=1 Tax=Streptomyces angustmyceticus TaxID=285578 RepID=UPI00381DF418
MDDGKAAGPKLKWWSRPGGTPRTEPSAESGPQPAPPADGTAPGASDAFAAQEPEDWIVRPPEPRKDAGPQLPPESFASPEAFVSPESPTSPASPASPATATGPATAEVGAADGELAASRDAAPEADAVGRETAVPHGATAADVTPQNAAGTPATGMTTARPTPSTMTLGRVTGAGPDAPLPGAPEGTPDEPPSGARRETQDGTAATTAAPAPATTETPAPAPGTPGPTPQRQQPLHAEDPYGTPPYGGPGPWAPAPPVQRPVATPAHGTAFPPPATGPQAAAAPATGPQTGAVPPPTGPQPTGAPAPGPQPTPLASTPRPATAPAVPAPQAAPADPPPTPDTAPQDTADAPFVPHPGDGGPRSAGAAPCVPPPPVFAGPATGEHGPAGGQGPHPAPHGAWQQYDPWTAPLQAGPLAPASRDRRRRGPLVAGAVALALFAGGIGGGIGAYVERYGGINDIRLPQSAADGAGRRPDSVAGIAQRALPGVVTIHVRGSAEQGTGTGFVLDRQGHILTNNHVVQPAGSGGEISVTFSGGQTAKARVVGQDGGYDLAVIQVEGVTGLRPLTLGNSDSVQVGDPVVAIGAPFDLANTVTSGIISAKQRPITAGGEKGDGSDVSYVDALQTDAPINPGNSGGPLVDARARVIGINSAIRAADSAGGLEGGGSQGGSIGLGFAIPINQAKRVAEELINTGRATHPVIGVTLEMEYTGDGARVGERSKGGKPPVLPDGPGAKAGIKPGDVITKVDGAAVHSGEELIVKIRSHRPGDTLVLTLLRGGKDRTVRLSLGSSSTG